MELNIRVEADKSDDQIFMPEESLKIAEKLKSCNYSPQEACYSLLNGQ